MTEFHQVKVRQTVLHGPLQSWTSVKMRLRQDPSDNVATSSALTLTNSAFQGTVTGYPLRSRCST